MKSEKFTLTKRRSFGRFIKMSMLSALLTIWYSGLEAQCPLVGNNLVQVSMDENCVVQITPDMILEAPGTGCAYVVQVLNSNGQPLQLTGTNPETGAPYATGDYSWISCAQLDQTLTVRVVLGTNSTWGKIKIEDKLAPVITCPAPVTVSCWDSRTFPEPAVTDNCTRTPCTASRPITLTLLSDVTTELECSNDNRAVRRIRYQAKDASNNLSTVCERVIYYSKITLTDVKFPKNYDGTPKNRPHLQCDGGWAWNPYKTVATVPFPTANWDKVLLNPATGAVQIPLNNYPDPHETGAPYVAHPDNITGYINGYKVGTPVASGAGLTGCTAGNLVGNDIASGTWRNQCDNSSGSTFEIDTFYNPIIGNNNLCKINTTYSDTKIDICAKSFKVLRYWTVLDWCSSGASSISNSYQIIKVIDDEGPSATIPPDVTTGVTPCLANPTAGTSPNIDIESVSSVVPADPYSCTGSWLAIAPISIFDCSDKSKVTYTVQFVLPDANGNPPANLVYVYQSGNVKSEQIATGPNAGRWQLTGLPFGCVWIKYTLYDECGNTSEAYTEIRVEDKTPPVPVCDEFTVVTLSNNGWAHVFAETFDDGSHDNCSAVTFSVRRLTEGCNSNGSTNEATNPFGPFVQFCCSDVGKEVMVELRVTDSYGNVNSCMVVATTQDKVPPVISCPKDKVISCGADTTLLASERPVWSPTALSTPYFSDNCNATMSWTNKGVIDNCGQGVITRTFTVTDNGGRTATCEQIITIRNNTPYTGPTAWPTSPKEVSGCMNVDTDPSKTGIPTIGNGACSQVAYTYEDQVFPFVDGVCFKILRKWTVIDWCKFAPNKAPNGQEYPSVPTSTAATGQEWKINTWSYTQIIKVSENDKPKDLICSKADTEAFGADCTGFVTLKNSATDCTPPAQLRWNWKITLQNGTVINKPATASPASADASGTYPVNTGGGSHSITWTVEDMCGNQATCTYPFKVVDKKKPTPYCISDITTVVMPTTGQVTIWANDFNLSNGSFDNCTAKANLKFSLSTNINETSRTYNCSQLGENQVTMYVWDEAGNYDYCTVTINIQANGTACSGARMAGNVGTESNNMVKDVQVVLQNMTSNETKANITNTQGQFEFVGMPEQISYKITPEKDVDHLNGVSTLDLVMIQRHILGIEKLNSAYKFIAADVNKDNKVTAGDLVELRKLILGIYAKLPNNKSWRFLDKAVNISDIANPWGVNEYISINNFSASMMNNNFVAVKVGDINGSAVTNVNAPVTQSRSAKTLTLVTEDQSFKAGESVKMDITADNFVNMSGAQWTFNYDEAALEFKHINAGALAVSQDNFHVKDGKVSFSWNDYKGKTVANNKVLFTIEFRATANNTIAKSLTLSSDITKAEAYTQDLSEINVGLSVRSKNASDAVFALDQNNPNPFTAGTTISFVLPEAGKAMLTIYDITGKVLKTISNEYPKGRNEVTITSDEFNAQGVMFYELESKGLKATKKMIYLNK